MATNCTVAKKKNTQSDRICNKHRKHKHRFTLWLEHMLLKERDQERGTEERRWSDADGSVSKASFVCSELCRGNAHQHSICKLFIKMSLTLIWPETSKLSELHYVKDHYQEYSVRIHRSVALVEQGLEKEWVVSNVSAILNSACSLWRLRVCLHLVYMSFWKHYAYFYTFLCISCFL